MALTDAYTTVPALIAWGTLDAADQGVLESAIHAASRTIDHLTARKFTTDDAATARVYRPFACDYARVDDFHTTTGLVVKTDDDNDGTYETTWTITTDFILEPFDGVVDGTEGWPYFKLFGTGTRSIPVRDPRRGRPSLQVTAKWGWAAVPEDVVLACMIGAEYLFKHKDAPFGIAGFDQFGAGVRLREHPTVKALVHPYARGLV